MTNIGDHVKIKYTKDWHQGIFPDLLAEYNSMEEACEAWHRGEVVGITEDRIMVKQEFWVLLRPEYAEYYIPLPIAQHEIEEVIQ